MPKTRSLRIGTASIAWRNNAIQESESRKAAQGLQNDRYFTCKSRDKNKLSGK